MIAWCVLKVANRSTWGVSQTLHTRGFNDNSWGNICPFLKNLSAMQFSHPAICLNTGFLHRYLEN